MLCPGKGTIQGRKILDGFANPYMLAVKLNRSRNPELRQGKRRARDEFVSRLGDVILIDRRLAMHGVSGSRLIARWSSEQVETKIVSHDAGQEFGVVTGSIPIWPLALEFGWFH